MRDHQLNRKGVDKEGSDMDAFTDTSIVSEEKERPVTPTSPPTASPPPVTPPNIEASSTHEDKIKVRDWMMSCIELNESLVQWPYFVCKLG